MTGWFLLDAMACAGIGYWCRSERAPLRIALLVAVAFRMMIWAFCDLVVHQ